MPRARKPRRAVAILGYTILLSLPFLGLLAVEGAGRFVIWLRSGVPGHSYGIYTWHPTLKGILRPLSYNANGKVINGQGFQSRTDISREPPADRTRVIVYGGSTAFAYNLPTGLDWPHLLQAEGEKAGRKLEVLNAGDINWTVRHALERSKADIPAWRPDIVILYEGVNEEPNYHQLSQRGFDLPAMMDAGNYRAFSTDFPQCRWFYRHTVVGRIFAQMVEPRLDAVFGASWPEGYAGESRPEVTRFFIGAVATAVDEWRAQGPRVIYAIQGHLPGAERPRQLTSYSRDAAATARAHGALVIDTQATVNAYKGSPADLFIDSGVHWTELGSRLMAKQLFDAVEAVDGWRRER
jgi:hypothetical protein